MKIITEQNETRPKKTYIHIYMLRQIDAYSGDRGKKIEGKSGNKKN